MEPPASPGIRERERAQVLEQLRRTNITKAEAAGQLHLSIRQLSRINKQFLTGGIEALTHGLCGAHSNRRFSRALRKEVIRLVTDLYDDYGPTLLAETLHLYHQITVSREWVRRLLLDNKKLVHGTRKQRRHRKKRPRRLEHGALIQFDGSDHQWFEQRGPRCTLLLGIDDATSNPVAHFATTEDTQQVLTFWQQYVMSVGIPRAVYTDFDSVYHNNNRPEHLTDFGRAMHTLHIEHIKAHSPQAKGRVERTFRTFQDRLVKELRRVGIGDIETANRFLDKTFLPARRKYNAQQLRQNSSRPKNVHRRSVHTAQELKNIFCFEEERHVYNDYTITVASVFYQLESSTTPLPLPRTKVLVRRWLDGSMHIFAPASGEEIAYHRIIETSSRTKTLQLKRGNVPSEDHPWRHKVKLTKRTLRNPTRKTKRR
jgi:hypothetical protein